MNVMSIIYQVICTLITLTSVLGVIHGTERSLRGSNLENETHLHSPSVSNVTIHTPIKRRVLEAAVGSNGYPSYIVAHQPGSLGKLDFRTNTVAHQNRFLIEFGGTGEEILVPKESNVDDAGRVHVRFQQEVHGIVVEGASLVVHAESDGTIDSINGEVVAVTQNTEAEVSSMMQGLSPFDANAEALLEQALSEAGLNEGDWARDKPELTVVKREIDGSACLAWKRLYRYTVDNHVGKSEDRADLIFADATSYHHMSNLFFQTEPFAQPEKPPPVLCAIHPKVWGSGTPTIKTYDCNESWGNDCRLISQKASPISTGDAAVDAAHNYALATYNYFWSNFRRELIGGRALISRVHFGKNYNNAFWDGSRVTYGDGDGRVFLPLSLSLDIVAHEFTHGLTATTSNLIYRGESGALNEAMSDIFAALIEREEGSTEDNIWVLGEEVFTPAKPGDALRSLSDPASRGARDYWPTRYTGDGDYGGVHFNSGIANLAFYLLVHGGTHPRGKTNVVVPGIGYINAAYIFYHANIDCLTPSSTFYLARLCTAETFGGIYSDAVHKAWDAVGVPRNPPSFTALTNGISLTDQDGPYWTVLRYNMGPVEVGDKVHCATAADDGDADMYVRFGQPAIPKPNRDENACYSYRQGSNESCITEEADSSTMVHVAIHAYKAFTNLSLKCSIVAAKTTDPTPAPSLGPTMSPTPSPTSGPTLLPTASLIVAPTQLPSSAPGVAPTGHPSSPPTGHPSHEEPTLLPTTGPLQVPTMVATLVPSRQAPAEEVPTQATPPTSLSNDDMPSLRVSRLRAPSPTKNDAP